VAEQLHHGDDDDDAFLRQRGRSRMVWLILLLLVPAFGIGAVMFWPAAPDNSRDVVDLAPVTPAPTATRPALVAPAPLHAPSDVVPAPLPVVHAPPPVVHAPVPPVVKPVTSSPKPAPAPPAVKAAPPQRLTLDPPRRAPARSSADPGDIDVVVLEGRDESGASAGSRALSTLQAEMQQGVRDDRTLHLGSGTRGFGVSVVVTAARVKDEGRTAQVEVKCKLVAVRMPSRSLAASFTSDAELAAEGKNNLGALVDQAAEACAKGLVQDLASYARRAAR
jgi:hypothetical protein